MNEPRPAMISARPSESRSSVANCWKTRTGSSEDSTVTALVSRMFLVALGGRRRAATAGAETAKSGRWCSPRPKTSSPTWSASSISIRLAIRCSGVTVRPVLGSGVSSAKV